MGSAIFSTTTILFYKHFEELTAIRSWVELQTNHCVCVSLFSLSSSQVLLDHGLYRSIPTDLRLSYCKLWRAIIAGDEPGIRKHSAKMNAVGAVCTMTRVNASQRQIWRVQQRNNAVKRGRGCKHYRFYPCIPIVLTRVFLSF